jgi:hypothetical protein
MSRSDLSQGQTPVVRRNQIPKTVRMAMLVVAGVAVVSVTHSLVAFNLLGRAWPPGTVIWESGLGPAPGLANGAGSWDECVAPSFAAWNAVLAPAGVSFAPVPATTTPGAPDMVNSMFFADDLFSTPFGESTLAVEQSWTITPPGGGIGRSVESDIAVNNAKKFNCYPGPLTLGPVPEGPVGAVDLGRVVTHEIGHAWGMGHPDDIGQTVAAIMNAFISDTDVLQVDDIAGVLTNYGIAVTSIAFPPRDQVLAFFLSLEAEYRDTLMREQNNPGRVDAEGSAVWFPEWLRYVLNDCSPEDAASRVFLQIRGLGIQPVCGVVPPGVIAFPPRNLSVDFLVALDNFYRDELGRGVELSYIDAEGKAVWLQEYLRYRVNGCGHDTALANVLTQIRGGGIPPVCAT